MLVEVLDRHPHCLAVGPDQKGYPARSIGILAGRLHREDVAVEVSQWIRAQLRTGVQREPLRLFGNGYVTIKVVAERSGIRQGRERLGGRSRNFAETNGWAVRS